MSHVPHSLHDAFPDATELLHRLKLDDHHFQTVSDRYHDLNKDIHRFESGVEAVADDHLEELKKQRLALLDEVSQIIERAKAA